MNGNWTLGLDIGLVVDHSALALVEWRDEAIPWPREDEEPPIKHLLVNNLKRWPLPCDYPQIRDDISRLVRQAGLARTNEQDGVPLLLDASGSGGERIVRFFDDAWARDLMGTRRPWPVWITGGQVPTRGRHVSRANLLMDLKILAQQHRLHIAPGLGLGEVFLDELRHLKLKQSKTGEDIYESVGKHDDVALAVALAAYGSRWHSGDEPLPYVAPQAAPTG